MLGHTSRHARRHAAIARRGVAMARRNTTPARRSDVVARGFAVDATTHFGDKTVRTEEKAGLVKGVFESVASSYDVMNDLMSGGLHRAWKDDYVSRLGLQTMARATGKAPRCLDVAGGTGDVAFRCAEALAAWLPPLEADAPPPLVVCDPNEAMLEVGREKRDSRGLGPECVAFDVGDAQALPYDDATFDVVTISFGLRNVTDIDAALVEMRRVLKPGGRFECLEFSKVHPPPLKAAYDVYSKNVIPELGHRVAGDRASYE